MSTPHPPPTYQPLPPNRDTGSKWLLVAGIAGAALVVGLVIGLTIGGTGTTDDEAEPETITETVTIDPADEVMAELNETRQSLDVRKADLDAREKDLDRREAKITGQERRIRARTFPGDGMYLVGTDIKPGTYRASGGTCYWARLSGTSGEFDDLIANGNGPSIVTISASDNAFQTRMCSKWTPVR